MIKFSCGFMKKDTWNNKTIYKVGMWSNENSKYCTNFKLWFRPLKNVNRAIENINTVSTVDTILTLCWKVWNLYNIYTSLHFITTLVNYLSNLLKKDTRDNFKLFANWWKRYMKQLFSDIKSWLLKWISSNFTHHTSIL